MHLRTQSRILLFFTIVACLLGAVFLFIARREIPSPHYPDGADEASYSLELPTLTKQTLAALGALPNNEGFALARFIFGSGAEVSGVERAEALDESGFRAYAFSYTTPDDPELLLNKYREYFTGTRWRTISDSQESSAQALVVQKSRERCAIVIGLQAGGAIVSVSYGYKER